MSTAISLAAALCIGVFCYCAAGFVIGRPPRLHRWRRGSAGVGAEQLWLAQAGLAVTPLQFWVASALAGTAALVACTFLTGTVLVAVVPGVAAASLPRACYGRRRAERLRAVQAAWPDALRDLLASIAAGRSLNGALVELASSGPEPLRHAFARFGAHARMLGTVPALEVIREELADPTSDRVIEVLVLASQRGGPIVKDILEDLVGATTHGALGRRHRHRERAFARSTTQWWTLGRRRLGLIGPDEDLEASHSWFSGRARRNTDHRAAAESLHARSRFCRCPLARSPAHLRIPEQLAHPVEMDPA